MHSLTFLNLPDLHIRVCRPELRIPPPLTPEGEPVASVPEKSFVQKYWIYMVVVLGALREFSVSFVMRHEATFISFNSLVCFPLLRAYTDCVIRSVISGPAEDSPSGDGKGGK